jgi:hypothetical protein
MKIIVGLALLLTSGCCDNSTPDAPPARFQIQSEEFLFTDGTNAANVKVLFKIDTATGKTWIINTLPQVHWREVTEQSN